MQATRPSIVIKPLFHIDVDEVVTLYKQNQTFLRPYEPVRPEGYLTAEGQAALLAHAEQAWHADTGYAFAVCIAEQGAMIGRISLSNIVRGGWQNATIGYFISKSYGGRGLATQAVRLAVDYAFGPAQLHRVQAAIMPTNERSLRVIEKSGFAYEGLARNYLQIDGVWADHRIYSMTIERWHI